MPDETTFAEAFERLRLTRGWTPADVARLLGVYPTEVSRWRRGSGISIRNVRKVADLFGADPAWLERLAGYDASHSASTKDTLEADRQIYRARYDYLMTEKIPRPFWESFLGACERLADVFRDADPGQLSSTEQQTLNRLATENNDPPSQPGEDGLIDCSPPSRRTLRTYSFSAAGAH